MWRRLTSFHPVATSPCKALHIALCQTSCGPLLEAFAGGAGKGEADESPSAKKPFITFVLGGPGSGKGTQCAKISERFGFVHLSAGDLLRSEISSNSDNGQLIQDIIKEGRIVPSEITVKLIQRAILSSAKDKILIDGFPRSDENRIAFEKIVGVEPDLVIYFDCPEEEMVKRVLTRNEGRIDDNIETVKKRLKVFSKLNLPVINYYWAKGKVCKIDAIGTVDEIFERVRPVFCALRLADVTLGVALGNPLASPFGTTDFSTQYLGC